MRGIGCVLVLCAAVAVAGCKGHPFRGEGTNARSIVRSLTPAVAPEGLIVQSVLLERPVGDPFLDRDLWASTRPTGSPEVRVLLAENGLRAGILSGNLPQRFQDLLDSESETVDPHEMSFGIRKEAVVPTAGPVDPCQFALLEDIAGKPKRIELKQARCGILVKPQVDDAGRVKVWCEPRIQHGERRELYRPTEDGTGLAKIEETPLERFASLGFETTLGPGDCLVIGWIADQPESLGAVMFGAEADNRLRQRVLVIRARQSARPAASDLPTIAGPYRQRR